MAVIYLNMATGGKLSYCEESEIKAVSDGNRQTVPTIDFEKLKNIVQDLHGNGPIPGTLCPHLLTLENIFYIAKTAIEQVLVTL